MYKLNINTDEFLSKHWQQSPLVIKGAFSDFVDPISADELAGLACEEEISSRVIVTQENDWKTVQGPIDDYNQFGESHWQLLVQAVNHWFPDVAPLIQAFRFIPDWRFDDLMVSFATAGGGVGPHIDNYDVFLLQGEGSRHWKVGEKQYQPRGGDENTALIDDFDPIIDVILEAGDMLYIPPGFPHCANTLTTALSYSFGFRAPSQQELFSGIADHLIDSNTGLKRFISTTEPTSPSHISIEQQQDMLTLLNELLQKPKHYQTVLGQLLSQNRFELDLCEPDNTYTQDDLLQSLSEGAEIHRIGGLKVISVEGDNKRIFINGEVFDSQDLESSAVNTITNAFIIDNILASQLCKSNHTCNLLISLLNKGYYYLG